jgi:lipid-A-disaccharide synthase
MGLFEVLSHLPRLLEIRRALRRRLLELRPDVYIGIDAPDFNLGLEIKLRRQGIRTVHYVSPTVWAWRKRRVHKIAKAADLVLCLFPFEPDFYRNHGVKAVYVGHPLADQIQPDFNPVAAREKLGLDPNARTVALLPGSRVSEVHRLAEPLLDAARILTAQWPGLQFAGAMASDAVHEEFRQSMDRYGFHDVALVDNDPRTVIAAADAVICASGTATLETLLVNRPLVMTYKISAASYNFAKYSRLIRPQLFSLPNILAGERLIPEVIQEKATAENLAREINRWLDSDISRENLKVRFLEIHEELQCDASGRAAEAVAGLIHKGRG